MSMNPKVTDIQPKPPSTPVPYATSDAPQYTPPLVSPTPIKDLAYGGNDTNTAMSGQLYRLERGYPYVRRGILVPAVPRTKGETIYVRDRNQAEVNKVLNQGALGTANSGTATPGTTNFPDADTGAVNRYRTPYTTNLQ